MGATTAEAFITVSTSWTEVLNVKGFVYTNHNMFMRHGDIAPTGLGGMNYSRNVQVNNPDGSKLWARMQSGTGTVVQTIE